MLLCVHGGSCSPAAILASPINILSPELERLRGNLVFMRVWTLPDYQLSLIARPCDPSGKQPRQHRGAAAPPDAAAATEPSCFIVGCETGCSISPPAPSCTHQLTPKDQGFLEDPKSHRTQGLNANAWSVPPVYAIAKLSALVSHETADKIMRLGRNWFKQQS